MVRQGSSHKNDPQPTTAIQIPLAITHTTKSKCDRIRPPKITARLQNLQNAPRKMRRGKTNLSPLQQHRPEMRV
jgi:hypothetical protein